MEVAFKTNQLRRNYEESGRAIRQWGLDVGRKYITRIKELYAVKDFQGAANIQAMRLHPLKGAKRGEWAINLTGTWRLIVTKGDTEEKVIIERVSNHYDD